MFTGIVETTGQLTSKQAHGKVTRMRFRVEGIQDDMKLGDSLACNGVCLTVVDFGPEFVDVDVISATLKVTAFKDLKRGDRVNFERSLKVSDRMGGHWVQGHVDGVGTVLQKNKKGKNVEFRIKAQPPIISELISKGSVAVNGISLTIQTLDSKSFTVAIIPHTFEKTNMSHLKIGTKVNLEVDILSKLVQKSVLSFLRKQES